MNKADQYMYELLNRILREGYKDVNPRPKYADGSPAYTLSVNGNFRSYDIGAGEFPICTLRPIAIKSAIKEILWIYQDASNDLNMLRDKYNVRYWDDWESKDWPGTIGARYGEVVRRYHLMENLLKELIDDPYGRRHIIDLWQYKELRETDGLAPCAFMTIWNVRNDGNGNEYLDVHLIQRSGDSMAASASGVNECAYAALLMMVARHCGYNVGMLYHLVCNEQIYDRHTEQAQEMIRRYEEKLADEKVNGEKPIPNMILNPEKKNFYDFTIDDFTLVNYDPMKPQLTFPLGI
jgi:thymidylate synthase